MPNTPDDERDRAAAEAAEWKRKYEAVKAERDKLRAEWKELEKAALFAAQHGERFVDTFYDFVRQACEENDLDAELLIQKLPPFTLDYLTKGGIARYLETASKILTVDEMRVLYRANEIGFQAFFEILQRKSSNA